MRRAPTLLVFLYLTTFSGKLRKTDVYCDFETNNISDIIRNHIERKEKARREKQNDKAKVLKGENYTLHVDVQAVKICPLINVNAMFYKMK